MGFEGRGNKKGPDRKEGQRERALKEIQVYFEKHVPGDYA